MSETLNKLSKSTVVLHWLVAILLICLLAVGFYMENTKSYGLYSIHKSIGCIALIIMFIRIVWRIKNGPLQPVEKQSPILELSAKISHLALLFLAFIMPITGMAMSIFGGHGLKIFALELLARNPNPANPAKDLPLNEFLGKLGGNLHEYVAYVLVFFIVIHILAAMKHHHLNKNRTLLRMLGR